MRFIGYNDSLFSQQVTLRSDVRTIHSLFLLFLFQVRELFRVAEEHSPSIVFIDEIDAVGTKRYDSNSGGEREIQRTMLELLNQLDGFDSRSVDKQSSSLV